MKKIIREIALELNTYSKSFIIGLGLLLILLIWAVDYGIIIDLSLSIFYLVPIVLLTWYVSRSCGIFASGVCSLCWILADLRAKKYLFAWVPWWNTGVRLGFFLIVTYLLWELKAAYEKEKNLARTDELTQAINRRYFQELLAWEIKRSNRYQHSLTLAYFDIDNFKIINDRWGHYEGDRLLQLVVNTVNAHVRETDIVARLGGDEFALLLPETDYEAAKAVLQRVQKHLLLAMNLANYSVSFSIGALTYRVLPDSVDSMVEQVDRLMYTVKNDGKNGLIHQIYDKNG